MGWLDHILGKLVEITYKPKGDQNGILNIKTAKNSYNTNLSIATPEAARAFAEVIVAGNQTRILESAEKLLSANSTILHVLSDSTAFQIANATIVASAVAASGVEGKVRIEGDTINLDDQAVVRFTRGPDK